MESTFNLGSGSLILMLSQACGAFGCSITLLWQQRRLPNPALLVSTASLPPKKTKNQESISTVDLNWLNLLITGSGGKHLYTFNPSTQDAVPGRSASLRPAWSIAWIPVQPGLHRERLSRKIKTKQNPQKRKNKTSESALVCVDTYSGTWGLSPLLPA